MDVKALVVCVLVLGLVLCVAEGKSMLEKIVKRSASFVTFNGQRVLPGSPRFETVPNYGMPNTAGTTVLNVNSTQAQSQNLTPASQTIPQVIPSYGSQTQFGPLLVPGFAPGFAPGYAPGYAPGFAPVLPQVPQHGHTPVQVPLHEHGQNQNPNPSIVVIQVPVPQIVQVPVNTSRPETVPSGAVSDLPTLIALIQSLFPNIQLPIGQAGSSSSSSANSD